jgi:hypothetical protein
MRSWPFVQIEVAEMVDEVWTILFSLIIMVSVVGNIAVLWIVFGKYRTIQSRQYIKKTKCCS